MTGWPLHNPDRRSRAGARPAQIDAPMTGWSPPEPVADAGRVLRDPDVLALLAAGDRKGAINALMDAHGHAVLGLCIRILRNRSLADDVLQRVFVEAYRDIERFQGRSSLEAWLLGIAGHRCHDAIKAQRRHLQKFTSDEQAVIDFADPDESPTARLEHVRLVGALEDCLGLLSDEVRMTLLLRFQQGRSYEDMSELLDANANTLHARVSRALPVLKRCLEGKGWER
jgi:RNA polymerase sigma-70 factor, ECF subfamily